MEVISRTIDKNQRTAFSRHFSQEFVVKKRTNLERVLSFPAASERTHARD